MAAITFFCAPKPFDRPHIALIQRNAIQSWLALGADVEVVLLGDEAGIAETACELDIRHISEIERIESGTPRLDSIFRKAEEVSASPIMAYLNSDIIALPDFVQAAQAVAQQAAEFLIAGQRWDLDITRPLEFTPGWSERLLEEAQRDGRRHTRNGSDYFIYPRGKFPALPPFALGRAGWDNWMIYAGRRGGVKVVDASSVITIIHQTHDYGHLPGGRPHYQHPESFNNRKMAGGEKVIFTLDDASSVLAEGRLEPFPPSWKKFWREVEITPLVRWKTAFLADIFHLVFHPIKTYRAARGLFSKMKKTKPQSNG
ncbi:MAG: hypothetical protein AB9891_11710 [Anaerolineaceae bacterium]